MAKIEGQCLCGGVRYASDAEPAFTAVCHCKHCQKTSGGAFSINLGMPADKVQLSGPSLASFEDIGESGKPVIRMFCKTCGSPIASDVKAFPGLLFIKAGTLNDTSSIKPGMHIWTDHAQSWVSIDPSAQKMPKNPS